MEVTMKHLVKTQRPRRPLIFIKLKNKNRLFVTALHPEDLTQIIFILMF